MSLGIKDEKLIVIDYEDKFYIYIDDSSQEKYELPQEFIDFIDEKARNLVKDLYPSGDGSRLSNG